MFYVCIASEEETPRTMYAEHFEDKIERDKRSKQLTGECREHDGALWGLYAGEEPFEAFYVRATTKPLDNEIPADGDSKDVIEAKQAAYKTRVDALALKAGKKTTSVLTAPEIDDVPVWFKKGFNSQVEMDFSTGKISQEEYNLITNPRAGGMK